MGVFKNPAHEEKDMKKKKRKEIASSIFAGFLGLILIGPILLICYTYTFAPIAWAIQYVDTVMNITTVWGIIDIPIWIAMLAYCLVSIYRALKKEKSEKDEIDESDIQRGKGESKMKMFRDPEHEAFFAKRSIGRDDVYFRSLIYTLGICQETRDHFHRIYDNQSREIRPACLKEGWQTQGTRKICLMAFNLWNGYVSEEGPRESSPEDLFASEFAAYFTISLRIRYPEYMQ